MEQQLLSSAIGDGGGGNDNTNDTSRGPPSTSRAVPPEGADVTYHTPAWHAARLAALSNVQRKSWEEFKAEQKAEAAVTRQAEAETEEAQRAFRAQLDADRARMLAHGVNQADLRKVLEAKDRKKKTSKKRSKKEKRRSKKRSKKSSKHKKDKKKKKRKRSKRDGSSSSSSDSDSSESESGSSDYDSDSDSEGRRKRKKEKKGGDDDDKGPDEALRLSAFLTSGK